MIDFHPSMRRAACAFALAAAIALLPGVARAQEDGFASLVAAERTFAADAARLGITSAFLTHAAEDSVLLSPGPVSATEQLAKQQDTPGLTLIWSPRIAGVARSGDLGFTSGPYRMAHGDRVATGEFLTIWSRGADGRWRWFLDHGLPPQASSDPSWTTPEPIRRFAFAEMPQLASTAHHDLGGTEEALNLGYIAAGVAALLPKLAEDGYILRPGRSPLSRAEADTLAPDSRRFVSADRLGSRISADGGLAATYGRLVSASGEPAYYVRIWRRTPDGWELLIDELI